MQNHSFFEAIITYSKEFVAERDREADKPEYLHTPKNFWEENSQLLFNLTLNQMDKIKALNNDFFGKDE